MPGRFRVGVGGWTFAPWRGVFYPLDLAQKRELEFASRALTSIEINGTFYSAFRPQSWRRWRDETPETFVFSVKASRHCTHGAVLAEAGPSIERFLTQGLSELGHKLGPINWQFPSTKAFEADDFARFLELLPGDLDGVPLRHALEVRHESFSSPVFRAMAAGHGCAVVNTGPGQRAGNGAGFSYVRVMATRGELPEGLSVAELRKLAREVRSATEKGDVFLYFIQGAKIRNPAAARALIRETNALVAKPTRGFRSTQSLPRH